MQELKADIKRAISSLPFWLSVALMMITICFGIGSKLLLPNLALVPVLMPYYHGQILIGSLRSDVCLLALPILCTLPYTAEFLNEFSSGYIKSYILKCDKSTYIRGKVLAPPISGGLALVFGVLILYFFLSLIYSPLEMASDTALSPLPEVLGLLLMLFMSGALWASLGSLLANISRSKYMAYAAPFVIFYVLVILAERYFIDIYLLNPKEWIKVGEYWPNGKLSAFLLTLMITVIICMINDAIIEKRLDEL